MSLRFRPFRFSFLFFSFFFSICNCLPIISSSLFLFGTVSTAIGSLGDPLGVLTPGPDPLRSTPYSSQISNLKSLIFYCFHY